MFVRLLRVAPRRLAAMAVGAAGAAGATTCHGAPVSHERLERLEQQVATLTEMLKAQRTEAPAAARTGQGDMVFSWHVELTNAFPEAARPHEKDMHGGFSEDPETGIVYTGIAGYGLCAISADLKTWRRLSGDDERLKSNIHGVCVFKHGHETRLALAQNEAQRILIVDLDGSVQQELNQPKGGEFIDCPAANGYYSNRPLARVKRSGAMPSPLPGTWSMERQVPAFACTDVAYLDGRLYVSTGYCEGDFVLTASHVGGEWQWGPIAWGGKGDSPGQFQTAHGLFAHSGHIYVANREAHQLVQFTPTGRFVRCVPDIPSGARICNVARSDRYFVMNALEPLRHTPARTAPIYAHNGEQLVSTIEPGDLGIPVLKHLHHVWPHYVTHADGTRRLYLLVHGWSAGKFAVLQHEQTDAGDGE